MLLAKVIKEQLVQDLIANPEYKDYLYKALGLFMKHEPYLCIATSSGEQKIPFEDVVYQRRFYTDHLEMLIAAHLWQKLARGELIYTIIPVPHTPFADKEHTRNQRVLDEFVNVSQSRDGLITKAQFWGGSFEEDGVIESSRPIVELGGYWIPTENSEEKLPANYIKGSATNFPLEVGYITPSHILAHLQMRGSVARWPYGMESIFFFELVEWQRLMDTFMGELQQKQLFDSNPR